MKNQRPLIFWLVVITALYLWGVYREGQKHAHREQAILEEAR